MQADPIEEWRRLREHYGKMNDEELQELAFDFGDLTETAQQVLRDEMRSRGLGEPQSPGGAAKSAPRFNSPQLSPPVIEPDGEGSHPQDDWPHEFTWKTTLCECANQQEAWLLSEALRRAGIESWIDGKRSSSRYANFDLRNPRVVVAADQLEEAQAIAARPIPPEIVDESNAETPEFQLPVCPKCGAGDPILAGVDPVNSWQCGACGHSWSDAGTALDSATSTG
jgi:ribosomal protein S27AE